MYVVYTYIHVHTQKLSLTPSHSHRLALVCPDSSDTAARYLDNEERVLAVKSKAPPTAMFVLCVFTPGTAILEIVNSIKQNVNIILSSDLLKLCCALCDITWNVSNQDTNWAEESVIVSEVSSFRRLKCMQEWYLGWERCPV